MRKFVLLCFTLACCFLIHSAGVEAEDLYAIFLDVGDGDCILLESDGEFMLIDTGRAGAWSHVREILEQEGADTLKYMVLTHPHDDHIGCAARITDAYTVNTVILPPIEYGTAAYGGMIEAVERNGIDLLFPRVGDTLELGSAEVIVYGPHPVAYSNENDWSIVLLVKYAGRSILFTGDIEARAETDLVAMDDEYPLKADVLKVAHHGSDSSTTRRFVEAVSPKYAVVSCRSNTRWDYPSTDVAMTLAECGVLDILTTEAYGDIEVCIDNDGELTIGPLEDDAVPDAAWTLRMMSWQ